MGCFGLILGMSRFGQIFFLFWENKILGSVHPDLALIKLTIVMYLTVFLLGRVVQLVGHLTRKRSWVRYPVWQHTFVSPSTDSRGAVVSYWRKYVHKVLVNRLGGLSLPRKSVMLVDEIAKICSRGSRLN